MNNKGCGQPTDFSTFLARHYVIAVLAWLGRWEGFCSACITIKAVRICAVATHNAQNTEIQWSTDQSWAVAAAWVVRKTPATGQRLDWSLSPAQTARESGSQTGIGKSTASARNGRPWLPDCRAESVQLSQCKSDLFVKHDTEIMLFVFFSLEIILCARYVFCGLASGEERRGREREKGAPSNEQRRR